MAEVLKAIAQYGLKAIMWVWNNKATILSWINKGMSIALIIKQIKESLGL